MNRDLRLYTFCNFYLSSIQQGIQSAHVTHSLFVKYPTVESNPLLWDWAQNDKTMIVLNGGTHKDIAQAYQLVSDLGLQHDGVALPFESFSEDEESLGGIMTSFGIVLPKQLYDVKYVPETGNYVFSDDDSTVEYKFGTPEHTFLKMLKSCGLAR